MDGLSPTAKAAAHLFAGNTSPMAQEAGMQRAMANFQQRAATARQRLENRYFQGRLMFVVDWMGLDCVGWLV